MKKIHSLISKHHPRWFWIRWTNNSLTYGRGNQLDKDIINDYVVRRIPFFEAIKINSRGPGSSAFWTIPQLYYETGNCDCETICYRAVVQKSHVGSPAPFPFLLTSPPLPLELGHLIWSRKSSVCGHWTLCESCGPSVPVKNRLQGSKVT